MKHFQKFKLILIILGFLSVFFCFLKIECFDQPNNFYIRSFLKDNNVKTSNSMDPNRCVICINSDIDLISYGFPGSGNETDPYRIENFSIITTKDFGLYLQNTTKYILIRNCSIHSHYAAIDIFNTTAKTITIKNNTCSSDRFLGIFIAKSPYISIVNNVIYDCDNGININDSPFSLIVNNTLFNNGKGIRSEYKSPYSHILENYCFDNQEAIWLDNSGGYFLIKDNLILENIMGIILTNDIGPYYPDNCLIINNLIEGNGIYGLLITSGFNTIYHNSFVNNNEGKKQAKDNGINNVWYNITLKEGNFWSDWWGIGAYYISGDANAIDMFPLEKPLHPINTKIPKIFIGRLVLILSLSLGIPTSILISYFIFKKLKSRK